jgi:HEPN domain-containing protein
MMVSRTRDWIRQAKRNYISAIVNYREGLHEEAFTTCQDL